MNQEQKKFINSLDRLSQGEKGDLCQGFIEPEVYLTAAELSELEGK